MPPSYKPRLHEAEEEAQEEVEQDDSRDRDVRPRSLLQERGKAERHAEDRREAKADDTQAQQPIRMKLEGESEGPRDRDYCGRIRAPFQGGDCEPEEEDCRGDDNAAAEDVCDESVKVLQGLHDDAPVR